MKKGRHVSFWDAAMERRSAEVFEVVGTCTCCGITIRALYREGETPPPVETLCSHCEPMEWSL